MRLLSQRTTGTFERDRHGHDAEALKDAGAGGDSHIWLAPANAKAIGLYVGGVLAERYPEHAARFAANAVRLVNEIDALTAELRRRRRHCAGARCLFHDAYQYFDDSFDLDAVGSITVSPDVQPSAKRLMELRQKIRTSIRRACLPSRGSNPASSQR